MLFDVDAYVYPNSLSQFPLSPHFKLTHTRQQRIKYKLQPHLSLYFLRLHMSRRTPRAQGQEQAATRNQSPGRNRYWYRYFSGIERAKAD